MSELPTASVVLPNYNHGRYVGAALHGILSQTVSPLEVIVIDDASDDDSVQVIRRIADRDPRIRFYENDRNRGVVDSLNRGAELARGEFVYFTSSDDRILPRFLETSLQLLAEHPQARVCCCDQCFIDDQTEELYPKHVPISRDAEFIGPSEVAERLRRLNDQIGSSGTLLHRETLAGLGSFSSDLRWHSDWFATLVIAFRHGVCYIPEPLSAFRLSDGGHSGGARDWSQQRRVLDNLLSYLESSEFADVAPAFYRARVLSTFGLGIVRAALARPKRRCVIPRLPYRAILWRELKNLLIWAGSPTLRRFFWVLRYRWRRQALGPGEAAATKDTGAALRPEATPGVR
jgi:glycosyltransferase involved in cell wall biosynthesis